MDLAPLIQFLSQTVPFDGLPQAALEQCAGRIEIAYASRRDKRIEFDTDNPCLYVIASGVFELRDNDGELLARLDSHQCFGFRALLTGEQTDAEIHIIEDGLLYLIPLATFDDLRHRYREFERFFNRQHGQRIRLGVRYDNHRHTNAMRLSKVMSAKVVSCGGDTSVAEAARLMSQHRISCLPVTAEGQLVGILTDRDLRNRVLAKAVDPGVAVKQVMTASPRCLTSQETWFDAQLLMTRFNIHHLPITEHGQLKGLVTSNDLMRQLDSDPALIIKQLNRCQDQEQLVQVMDGVPNLVKSLVAAEVSAEQVGRLLTAISDRLTERLIALAQRTLGEAPMDWCWLAFGSQARMDQVIGSDQDNGLLLAEEPDATQQRYFLALAESVCRGLDRCGFVLCKGEIMAMNPKWCRSLHRWQQQFSHWMSEPEPKAVMHSSIFFDIRGVAGDTELARRLQLQVLEQAQRSEFFLAYLAQNCVARRPPLGFFRQWVLDKDGEQKAGVDLKHRGLAIINDIGRLYALACGSDEVETPKRLKAAMEAGLLTRKDALNLADALEFIRAQRLDNQHRQWLAGDRISNYLEPKSLSQLVRHQLKDAFVVLGQAQDGVKLKFGKQL
ncbi:DUF294 nucleotidyltransferase-like domain-containing protein [Ferrimonas kyonanensis]|uniref:DUF294 nucleotidyltransferase-like domain-containing protein n=1 Tax=Ferrimonas kyonanensis TaxID=364763 RepID=UPI0004242F2C|nr:DUF294 nucleotidyltransferase-like domain-containing protein [Ferrimonas kyonanensis]